jgi:citrate lyase subunit beta/citryl-CoA lyase
MQLAGRRLAFITLPKANGVADVALALNALHTERARHGLDNEVPLHVLIETHGALHEAFAIAALPGVEALDFGLMDFVSSHQGAIPATAMRSPGQFEHALLRRAKTEVVAAALTSGRIPAHNVSLALDDAAAVEADARRAREEFGFLRMWSIHPAQIAPILRGMAPRREEIERAAEILLAAATAAWGPIRFQGELFDRASYRYCWQVLARAKAAGADIPKDALNAFFT